MRIKTFPWLLLCLFGFGSCAPEFGQADSFPKIPPGFETKWDISKKDNDLSRTFTVTVKHFYDFGITFRQPDEKQSFDDLRQIVGDGAIQYWPKDPNSQTPVQANTLDEERQALQRVKNGTYIAKHVHPGITIPIHIKIEMLDSDESGKTTTIIDKVVDTMGADSWGNHAISRNVASVDLAPGKYVVNLTTTEETALPSWVDTYFYVGGRFFK